MSVVHQIDPSSEAGRNRASASGLRTRHQMRKAGIFPLLSVYRQFLHGSLGLFSGFLNFSLESCICPDISFVNKGLFALSVLRTTLAHTFSRAFRRWGPSDDPAFGGPGPPPNPHRVVERTEVAGAYRGSQRKAGATAVPAVRFDPLPRSGHVDPCGWIHRSDRPG